MSSRYFHMKEHIVSCQHIREYPHATANSQEDPLRLAVKQYTPVDNPIPQPGDVTIIGAHANGMPKELYEPLWDEIYTRLQAKNGPRIRAIWIADVAHQGASGALNEHVIGNDPSWFDHSRDLLHMINHFRSQMPRPLVGIGHSMGATQLVYLSLLHPRLLTTLVLLEPVIDDFLTSGPDPAPVRASTFRRDLWPSREAAVAAFSKNPFFQRWDPRVLRRWNEHGLRSLPTLIYPVVDGAAAANDDDNARPVTLTTTKHQEVFTFARPCYFGDGRGDGSSTVESESSADVRRLACPDLNAAYVPFVRYFYRHERDWVFQNLPYVRPSVLYVFGAESEICLAETRHRKGERTGTGTGGSGGLARGQVESVVLERAGHLVPMEAVDRCAERVVDWLPRRLEQWRDDERRLNDELHGWHRKSARQKVMVSDAWKERITAESESWSSSKGRTRSTKL